MSDLQPFGAFRPAGARAQAPRLGVLCGDQVLDLGAAPALGRVVPDAVLAAPVLNPLLALGPQAWEALREAVSAALAHGGGGVEPALRPLASVTPVLPIEVADYVDFFTSRVHASTAGRIRRPGGDGLTPNWDWMPVGYHGRAGTVVVGGTDVRRPWGQVPGPDGTPRLGPSAALDFEAELGLVVGTPSPHGEPVPVDRAEEHLFGVVVLNDWSARDIQAWESAPLGPHLGKSFATSISPWVVPLAALAGARVAPPPPQRGPLPHLRQDGPGALDLDVVTTLNGQPLAHARAAELSWTPAQLVAHLTSNGAALRTGDLLGTGTISGEAPEARGCLLERTWSGRDPVTLADGSVRTWLQDGDEVVIAARTAGATDLGEVRGRILPAHVL